MSCSKDDSADTNLSENQAENLEFERNSLSSYSLNWDDIANKIHPKMSNKEAESELFPMFKKA